MHAIKMQTPPNWYDWGNLLLCVGIEIYPIYHISLFGEEFLKVWKSDIGLENVVCMYVFYEENSSSSSNNKIKTKFLLVYACLCTCCVYVCMYLAALAITCAFCVLGVYLFDFKFEHNKMKTKWINWMLLVMPVKLIKFNKNKNWSVWNSLTCTMRSGGKQVTDLRAIEVVENTYLGMASACKTGENELRVYSQIKSTHARMYLC